VLGVKKASNNKKSNRPFTQSPAVPAMKERILVVNDEEQLLVIVCAMLTAAGYQCKTAANGIQALSLLDSGEEFDLLFSNLMMPNMDGIELLKRTREKFSDIPFVMESSCRDMSVVLAAVRNGAYDYLQAPFDREQLLVVVRRALEYRRLKLENRVYQTNLEVLIDAHTKQLQKAMADLECSYGMTLEALGAALDLKDAAITGHSRRVAVFTIGLARAMGLSKDQIDVIARGACRPG
jgi:response regulator RpfG family c-di-GMP phosphodiesterase